MREKNKGERDKKGERKRGERNGRGNRKKEDKREMERVQDWLLGDQLIRFY